LFIYGGFPGGSVSKESACNARDVGSIPPDPLEEGMATHCSILADVERLFPKENSLMTSPLTFLEGKSHSLLVQFKIPLIFSLE